MPGKISILKENGETLTSNVVSMFTIPETEKKYIITTENTVDPHGLTVLHVSEIVDDTLTRIATNEEWDTIKTIMRAVISGNVGSYTYLPPVENARVNGPYSRDISVSATAVKQMTDAYLANAGSAPAQPAQIPVAAQPAPADMQAQAAPVAPGAPVPGVAPQVAAQPMGAPSSIFPESNVVPTEENEISPGIAEVGGAGPANSMSAPVVAAAENAVPVDPAMASPATATAAVEPVMPITVTPAMDPMDPNAQSAMAPVPGMEGMQPAAPMAVPGAPVVPQAQIVQPVDGGVPEVPGISLNFNAAPSFAPNATLDEVVAGSQEMFMECVRNLVQTMTEKIYRDLYQKEAMLNERETMLNEREKVLNAQMMSMMNNFGAQGGMATSPQMMGAQPMQQPMAQPMAQAAPMQQQMAQPMPQAAPMQQQMAQPMGQVAPMQQQMAQTGAPAMSPIPPMVGAVPVNPVANVNPVA